MVFITDNGIVESREWSYKPIPSADIEEDDSYLLLLKSGTDVLASFVYDKEVALDVENKIISAIKAEKAFVDILGYCCVGC